MRRPAFAVAVSVLALLLFTWPLLRTPRMHVVPAVLYLLGLWAAEIVVLWALSRALRPASHGRGGVRGV